MPKKAKKTREEKIVESYFPIDETNLKYTTEKQIKESPPKEEVTKGSIEKEYKKPDRSSLEIVEKTKKNLKNKKIKKSKKIKILSSKI